MMLTYQVETWAAVADDMAYLWPAHWEEVAGEKDKIKLDVDYEGYAALERSGSLHIVTCRDRGKIVGYHLSFVKTHLHYKSTLMAVTDVYYLDKPYRKGFAAIKLFREVERTLKDRGVQRIFSGTKTKLHMGALFRRLKWHEVETLYAKFIGD